MNRAQKLAHFEDFWGDDNDRPNPWGTPGDRRLYAEGYHRGEDISNKGATEKVPALRTGKIIDSGVAHFIGPWVAVKPDKAPSQRDIYCHMHEPSMRKSGRIKAADIIGRTAAEGEVHGKAWFAPHLHFVVAENSHGGFDVNITDFDPRPIIKAALRRSAIEQLRARRQQRSTEMEFFAVTRSNRTEFFIYSVIDAQRITHAEAVAHNAAAGLDANETLFSRISVSRAGLILDGVRFRRARFQGNVADATTKALDELIAELAVAEVEEPQPPDDGRDA